MIASYQYNYSHFVLVFSVNSVAHFLLRFGRHGWPDTLGINAFLNHSLVVKQNRTFDADR